MERRNAEYTYELEDGYLLNLEPYHVRDEERWFAHDQWRKEVYHIRNIERSCHEKAMKIPQAPFNSNNENKSFLCPSKYKKWYEEIIEETKKAQGEVAAARGQQEKDKIEQSKCRSYAEGFKKLRPRPIPPLSAVQRENGSLAFSPGEMFEIIEDTWVEKIFNKYRKDCPPDWEDLLHHFGSVIGPKKQQGALPKLTGKALRTRFKKVNGVGGA